MRAPQINLPVLDTDDVAFIHSLREALANELVATDELSLVKVDRWFGAKWLEFSGV